MPGLLEEKKAELVLKTKGAAEALIEDLEYLREVIAKIETSKGELRRLSGLLRRLLVEADIIDVSTPRMGKIKLISHDNKWFFAMEKRAKMLFFCSGGVEIFGTAICGMCLLNAGPKEKDPEAQTRRIASPSKAHDPTATVELHLSNFMEQRVLCYDGKWVTRREVIKHIANVGSGVHSDTPKKREDKLIEHIRGVCSFSISDKGVDAHILPELGPNSPRVKITPKAERAAVDFTAAVIDPVLIEVLATAKLLIDSPDIKKLEAIVRQELGNTG